MHATWDRVHCTFGTCSNEDAACIVHSIFSEAPRSNGPKHLFGPRGCGDPCQRNFISQNLNFRECRPPWIAWIFGRCGLTLRGRVRRNVRIAWRLAQTLLQRWPQGHQSQSGEANAAMLHLLLLKPGRTSAMVSSRERVRKRDLVRLPRACICAVRAQPIGLRQ